MRGEKHNDKIKEAALALLASGKSVSATAKELKLSYSTVYGWFKDKEIDDPVFEEVRNRKKEEFIEGAWDIVMRSQRLITRRLDRAEKEEAELDRLLDEVECMSDEDISDVQRRVLVKRIMDLKLDDIGKLGTVMGTMFDKHSLALNQPTVVHGGEVAVRKFEDL